MEQREDAATFAVKKATLYFALALSVAFASGFGVAWSLFRSPATAPEISTQGAAAQAQTPSVVQVDIEGRPFLGPEDAPVTIVEFTDYECPFCGRHFQDTMPQLLREYEGRIKYVILNFPISNIHPFAQQAGQAAECADDQGGFWDYHDILFQNQHALDVVSLNSYAEQTGLDSDLFSTCLGSGATAQLVLDDLLAGATYGVSGTPTFFINGQILVGAQPFSSFQSLIDAALTR